MGNPPYPGPVRLLRQVVDRWNLLIRELTKFGIIGLVNTAIDFAVLNAILLAADAPLKAKVASTTVSATTSYFMNRHWTFRHRSRSGLRREYSLFFIFNGVGLAIALTILGITKYGLGLESLVAINIANLLGLVIGTVFRFWSYRRWVFLHPEDADVTIGTPEAAAEDAAIADGVVPNRGVSNGAVPDAAVSGRTVDVATEGIAARR